MTRKADALAELLAALEEDKQEIDDKNVDTEELEALIERQKNEYLQARAAARQRVSSQHNAA